MSKEISISKFLKVFAGATLFILLTIGGISYTVDPFFQFRVKDKAYLLNPRFVNQGLIKNSDYNTVIIGSSMVQNFDLSILRQDPNVKPLKIASGGLNTTDMVLLYSLVDKKKVNKFIINIDLTQFNVVNAWSKYPDYIFKDDIISKLKYLYGYETNMRYIPVDIALAAYYYQKEIPENMLSKMSVDDIGSFGNTTEFSADAVKNSFLSGRNVAAQDFVGMEQRLRSELDKFIISLSMDSYPDSEFTFILPPYSSLYWSFVGSFGYYQQLFDFVPYLVSQLEKYPNVKVVCFYDIDEISDINNYSDMTHFCPRISNKIVENLNNPAYYLTPSNVEQRLIKTDSLTRVFVQNNKDWAPIGDVYKK